MHCRESKGIEERRRALVEDDIAPRTPISAACQGSFPRLVLLSNRNGRDGSVSSDTRLCIFRSSDAEHPFLD